MDKHTYYRLVASDDQDFVMYPIVFDIEDARRLAIEHDCNIIEVIVETTNLGKPV